MVHHISFSSNVEPGQWTIFWWEPGLYMSCCIAMDSKVRCDTTTMHSNLVLKENDTESPGCCAVVIDTKRAKHYMCTVTTEENTLPCNIWQPLEFKEDPDVANLWGKRKAPLNLNFILPHLCEFFCPLYLTAFGAPPGVGLTYYAVLNPEGPLLKKNVC